MTLPLLLIYATFSFLLYLSYYVGRKMGEESIKRKARPFLTNCTATAYTKLLKILST